MRTTTRLRAGVLASVFLVVMGLAVPVFAGEPVPAPEPKGLAVWALLGTNPELLKSQEVRLGYEGLLPRIELSAGVMHLDAPDAGVEEWSGRAYVIAHALDAAMIASLLGVDVKLPPGNLYGGLFGQYTFDRSDEWSGGYVLGGLVDWPKGWQTVAEYGACLWNNDSDAWMFSVGLRRRF